MPLAVITFLATVAWWDLPSAVEAPRWILVGVAAAAALLQTRIEVSPAHKVGAAFLLWCVASIGWSISPLDSAGAVVALAVLAAVFCVAAETEDLEPTMFALALGACINAAAAIAQLAGLHVFVQIPEQATMLPIGLMGNKNHLANLGVLGLFAATAVIGRRAGVALWLGSAAAALLPASRGALLALVAAAAASRWKAFGLRWWPFALGCAILAAAAVAVDLWIVPERFGRSVATRFEMWDWTVSNLAFFGWGIGTYGAVFPFEHASNDALELAFEVGPGVLLLAVLARQLLHAHASPAWTMLLAVLVESLVSSPLHQPATAVVAVGMAGWIAGDRWRAVDPSSRRGAYREVSAEDAGPLWVGAVCEADLRRIALPARPEPARGPDNFPPRV